MDKFKVATEQGITIITPAGASMQLRACRLSTRD